jgi:hypothetical protein
MAHQKTAPHHTMGMLSGILLGLDAGALAKFILPGRDPGGIIISNAGAIMRLIARRFVRKKTALKLPRHQPGKKDKMMGLLDAIIDFITGISTTARCRSSAPNRSALPSTLNTTCITTAGSASDRSPSPPCFQHSDISL